MSGGPVVVLFVDDEPAILRAITRVVASPELEVLTADGPDAALATLASRPIDVIVSDFEMPEMTGLELLARVRREHPRVLRMMLTGAATLERALAAINEGEVVRLFTKPFDVDVFREAMRALGERIRLTRRDRSEDVRQARRAELHGWIEARFPGLLEVPRAPDGAVVVDVDRLGAELEAAGVAGARALLEGDAGRRSGRPRS